MDPDWSHSKSDLIILFLSLYYIYVLIYYLFVEMIQQESTVIVADNTGAKTAQVIRVLKGSTGKIATIGDIVVVAIKSATPSGQVAKASVQWWVVVRTRKEIRRNDGTYIRFDDNAIALVWKNKEPIWKRIFGPVAKELREKWFRTVAVIAEEII